MGQVTTPSSVPGSTGKRVKLGLAAPRIHQVCSWIAALAFRQDRRARLSWDARTRRVLPGFVCLGAALACLLALAAARPGPAAGVVDARADVLFLFDTSGSMSDALAEASREANDVASQLRAEISDVQFAVAEVQEYPGLYGGSSTDVPWRVAQPVTGDADQLAASIASLSIGGGGDNPESYGRALYEADVDPSVGWRPGARRLVVLLADDVPHDDDLNAGIPAELQIRTTPFNTGVDPGRDAAIGTADDLDWQATLQQLNRDGVQLLYVLYSGRPEYLPYWQIWTGITGGAAAATGSGELTETVVRLVSAAASRTLPPCPPGQGRNSAGVCAAVEPARPAPGPTRPAPGPALAEPTSAVVFVSGLASSQRFADPGSLETLRKCPNAGTWQETAVEAQKMLKGQYRVFLAPAAKGEVTRTNDCPGTVSTDPIMHQNTRDFADQNKNGDRLSIFLGHLKRRYGITNVWLVGHSYGGIWSRSVLTRLGRAPKPIVRIDGVITVGTPHTGSFGADIYQAAVVACATSIGAAKITSCGAAAIARGYFGETLNGLTNSSLQAWNPSQTNQARWGCTPVIPLAGTPFRTGSGVLPLAIDYVIPNDGIVGRRSALGIDAGITQGLGPRKELDVVHADIVARSTPSNRIQTTDREVREFIVGQVGKSCASLGALTTMEATTTTAQVPPRAQDRARTRGSGVVRTPFVRTRGGSSRTVAPRPRSGETLLLLRATATCGGRAVPVSPLLGLREVQVADTRSCRGTSIRIAGRGRSSGGAVIGQERSGVLVRSDPARRRVAFALYGLRQGVRARASIRTVAGRRVTSAVIVSGRQTVLRLKRGAYSVTVKQIGAPRALRTTLRV